MFNISSATPNASPAIQSHFNTQMAFFTNVSQKVIDGMQKIAELNIQVAKTVLEESATNARQILSSKNQNEAFSIVAGQSQPALEKVRAYQQHVQKICADTQAEVVQSIQSFVPESTRAAEAMVKEVSQKASEQTAIATQRQQEALDKISSATKQNVDRAIDSTLVKTANQK